MDRKASNKTRKKAWKREQEIIFKKSLPFSRKIFEELLDYLDIELGIKSCDNNYQLSTQFLSKLEIQIEEHVDFFINNGGGCDCEILANMDELFEKKSL